MDLFGTISCLLLVFAPYISGVILWQIPLDNTRGDSTANVVSRDGATFVAEEKRNLETKDCPEIYKRYSTRHIFCLEPRCQTEQKFTLTSLKDNIVRMHNELRSSLARGATTQFSLFPRAANMMELEWDDELARLAEAEAKLCPESLDEKPKASIAIGNFSSIGQILFNERWMNDLMQRIEKEASSFYPGYINQFHLKDDYENFAQVAWAETWKMGCSRADVVDGENIKRSYFICNYGPKGNIEGKEVYKPGKPCSQCPKNTECSKDYPGLCKSKTSDGPQRERPPVEDFLLYCDFSEDDPVACRTLKITGDRNFTTKHIYSGNYKSVVLREGEKVGIDLIPVDYEGGYCPFLYIRAGSNNAADSAGPMLKIYSIDETEMAERLTGGGVSEWFTFRGVDEWKRKTRQVRIQLWVDNGYSPQYCDIKAWGIRKGRCTDFMKQ
uniref:Venom toxin n=1 Tax=Hemiscorpius lepturus TaxID=520031 RepID=A0A1L4BJ58_HEMLE|nr:venom toxin [Hemiscorpius lepturus]